METLAIQLRKATADDITAIQYIACLTWPVAYHNILAPGQVSYMLNMMYSQEVLHKQMTREGHQFWLGFVNNVPSGFAGFSPENEEHHVWKLHKLYVLPGLQKTGLGKLLLQKAEEEARANGAQWIKLQVNRNNNASAFYHKHGFVIAEEKDFDIGNGFLMEDYVMEKGLD
jgi:GNAT superfamily N-acetyltransferase